MKTKEILEGFASKAIFKCLTAPAMADYKPLSLYLPARKTIKSKRYYSKLIAPFDGKIEGTYNYFFNLKPLPIMRKFYVQGKYFTDSFVYTMKETQRHDIVNNSVFYFGHVTYFFNKVCSLFVEENYEDIVALFGEYFKKGFAPEDVENYFPNFPKCTLLGNTHYYVAGNEKAFISKIDDNVRSRLEPGTRRRLYRDLKFAKCIAVTEYEHQHLRSEFPYIMYKVNLYLLMLGYSMHEMGVLDKNSRFYIGFKSGETERCQRLQEVTAYSSSQEDHQSDQRSEF